MEANEPRRVVIPLKPILEPLLEGKITKDLCEGEEICPTCGGFSLTLQDNPYFKQVDLYHVAQYKNEQLVLMRCPNCFNGVVSRCKLCGEIIRRGWLKHDCDQQRALDRAAEERKEADVLANAPIAPPDVESACKMFFSDYYNDGFFEDWDEFFEEWWDEDKDKEVPTRPEYVWITVPDEFRIDAKDICENATEDLYEGAYDDISEDDFKRLQDFLDEWCRSSGVRKSYRAGQKYKVKIPWEEYERSYGNES